MMVDDRTRDELARELRTAEALAEQSRQRAEQANARAELAERSARTAWRLVAELGARRASG